MKCIILIPCLSIVALARYGVPEADPSPTYQQPQTAYGNAAGTYAQAVPRPDYSYDHGHDGNSDNKSGEENCKNLKAKCSDDAPGECEKPKIYSNGQDTIVKCEEKDGMFVQLVNEDYDVIAYGFNVVVKGTCGRNKWRLGSEKVKGKKVSCQYYALPDVINVKEFRETRSGEFALSQLFDATHTIDLLKYVVEAITADSTIKVGLSQNFDNLAKAMEIEV